MRLLRILLGCLLVPLACWTSCARPEALAQTPVSATAAAPTTSPAPEATMSTTPPASRPNVDGRELATFGSGCFWCTEAVLEQLEGVIDVTSGYAGGTVEAPTYEQVCSGTTGHAEVVQVTFDPQRIRYEALLDWFFRSHDPTTLNRQGPDEGTQYRSVIFFHSPAQHAAALAAIAKAQPGFAEPIVTEVSPAPRFWPAEPNHQDYFRNNPTKGYCRAMIAPKLKKLGLERR